MRRLWWVSRCARRLRWVSRCTRCVLQASPGVRWVSPRIRRCRGYPQHLVWVSRRGATSTMGIPAARGATLGIPVHVTRKLGIPLRAVDTPAQFVLVVGIPGHAMGSPVRAAITLGIPVHATRAPGNPACAWDYQCPVACTGYSGACNGGTCTRDLWWVSRTRPHCWVSRLERWVSRRRCRARWVSLSCVETAQVEVGAVNITR